MDVVVNPPEQGEPSYELFIQEKSKVLGELKLKAKMVTQTLNSIEGVSCNEVMGAMYAFPRLHLPEKAIAEAEVCVTVILLQFSYLYCMYQLKYFTTCGCAIVNM